MSNLHFILVPLLAQGHFIPMVDIARLIASRGVLVTLVTTPVNAARIKPLIDRQNLMGLRIQLLVLKFPSAENGLPEGCESFEFVPELGLVLNFFDAINMLEVPLLQRLKNIEPKPNCIISDYCTPWTQQVAHELQIPRIIFHGPCCFFLLAVLNVSKHEPKDESLDEHDTIVIPDLPVRIEVRRNQARGFLNFPSYDSFVYMYKRNVMAEATADGIIINTFQELESEYIEMYKKEMNKKVWPIGPVSLCNKEFPDRVQRGNRSSIDTDIVLSWLDSRADDSVVYVSFGTVTLYNYVTLIEIGLGLEASNLPFIWVIRESEWVGHKFQEWLKEYKFESRTSTRGLIIIGWAPQALIMSHRAVGSFVTHCGWNSTLEAISAGLPLVTWPYYADQFLNSKFVVEVLKVGVELKADMVIGYEVGDDEVVVRRDEVEKCVLRVMDRGEEGEERRKRVKELAKMAKNAMEIGGSSYNNLSSMIQYIEELQQKK